MVSTIESLCKSVRSVGYPKKREQRLEAYIRTLVRNEGLNGVVQRFKQMQALRLEKIQMGQPRGNWIALTRSKKQPKHQVLRELWSLSDRKFFAVTGAVINSVVKPIESRQLKEWYDQVMQSPHSPDFTNIDIQSLAQTVDLGSSIWHEVAMALPERFSKREAFGLRDITKQSIPIGNSKDTITFTRKAGIMTKDLDQVISAYSNTLLSRPSITDSLDQISQRLSDNEEKRKFFRSIRYSDIESIMSLNGIDTRFGKATKSIYPEGRLNGAKLDKPVVGFSQHIPKPGGKDRAIANPNRYVQYQLNPLGELLQDKVYFNARLGQHIDVLDQDRGRREVHKQIAKGNTLASVDLSAATDNMDFQQALQLTGYDFWKQNHTGAISLGKQYIAAMAFTRYPQAMIPVEHRDSVEELLDAGPEPSDWLSNPMIHRCIGCYILSESMDFFNEVRTANWKVDTNTPRNFDYISFDRGQPLGTRPSFPLLTFANAMAAYYAVTVNARATNPLGPDSTFYRVVGDDIVLSSNLLNDYGHIMSDMLGCKVNPEKTLTSNRVAEFVGYLYTSKDIMPKKPTVTKSQVENATKFGFSNSNRWLEPLINDAKSAMLIEHDSISDIPYGESLKERLSGHKSTRSQIVVSTGVQEVINEEFDKIKPSTEMSVSGQSVARHAHYSSPSLVDLEVPRPEDHLSEMKYDKAQYHFDHHKMKNVKDIERDSKYTYLKKKQQIAKLSQQLHDEGSAIIENRNVTAVFDETGQTIVEPKQPDDNSQVLDTIRTARKASTPKEEAPAKSIKSLISGIRRRIKRDPIPDVNLQIDVKERTRVSYRNNELRTESFIDKVIRTPLPKKGKAEEASQQGKEPTVELDFSGLDQDDDLTL